MVVHEDHDFVFSVSPCMCSLHAILWATYKPRTTQGESGERFDQSVGESNRKVKVIDIQNTGAFLLATILGHVRLKRRAGRFWCNKMILP